MKHNEQKKNANIVCKNIKGRDYYYATIYLKNGQVIEVPIKLSFYNYKLDYKIKSNLD